MCPRFFFAIDQGLLYILQILIEQSDQDPRNMLLPGKRTCTCGYTGFI